MYPFRLIYGKITNCSASGVRIFRLARLFLLTELYHYNTMIPKGGKEMLPKDPHMLASFLNLKLRDFYPSLDALCDDLGVDKQEIVQKLEAEEYSYDPERNQFI